MKNFLIIFTHFILSLSCYSQDTLEQKIIQSFELKKNESYDAYDLRYLNSRYTEYYIDKAQEFHKESNERLLRSYNREVFMQSYKNKVVATKLSISLAKLLPESRSYYFYHINGLDTIIDKLYFNEVCSAIMLMKREYISEEIKNVLVSNFELYYDDHESIPMLLGTVFEKNNPELIQKVKNKNQHGDGSGNYYIRLDLMSKAAIARMGSQPELIEIINSAKACFAKKRESESSFYLERYVELLGYLKDKNATDILINELLNGSQNVIFGGRLGLEQILVNRLTTVIKNFPVQPQRNEVIITPKEVIIAKKWLMKHKNTYKISNDYLK